MPPSPTARLHAPHPTLASCVPAYLSRSTLGCGDAGGFNHYPASPLCAIGWMLEGTTLMVIDGVIQPEPPALPGQAIFCGPRSTPYSTYNTGAARFFVAVFYPDAMHALCGRDLSSCVGQYLPVEELLGQDWLALTATLQAAADDEQCVRLLDEFLRPRWQAVCAQAGGASGSTRGSLGDWSRNLALRAATSHLGRSVRHAERRIRTWAGMPMRTLQRISRAERVLVLARAEQAQGTLSWVNVAADTGYADQAHLSRETRAISGLSPTELARAILHDDSYWMYRIWS